MEKLISFEDFLTESASPELQKAINILRETEVPFLFTNAKTDKPVLLIKYIADQGRGLHAKSQSSIETHYQTTCDMFTKELTDAAITAFPEDAGQTED